MASFLKRSAVAMAASALAVVAAPAAAQTAGDAAEVISQRRTVLIERPAVDGDAPAKTGQDLYLLREHKAFFLRAVAVGAYNSNAFLSRDERDDVSATGLLEAGFDSRIAETVDVLAGARVVATRYDRFEQLGSDEIGPFLRLSLPFAPNAEVGFDYSSAFIFERGFDDNVLDSHNLHLFARAWFGLTPATYVVLRGEIGRIETSPNDFRRSHANVSATAIHNLTPELAVGGGLSLDGAIYDDYFEAQTGETREDLRLTPSAFLSYQPTEWATLSAGVRYTRNFSTLNALDYKNVNVSPQINLTLRF